MFVSGGKSGAADGPAGSVSLIVRIFPHQRGRSFLLTSLCAFLVSFIKAEEEGEGEEGEGSHC